MDHRPSHAIEQQIGNQPGHEIIKRRQWAVPEQLVDDFQSRQMRRQIDERWLYPREQRQSHDGEDDDGCTEDGAGRWCLLTSSRTRYADAMIRR
jgi:hypothetical protein